MRTQQPLAAPPQAAWPQPQGFAGPPPAAFAAPPTPRRRGGGGALVIGCAAVVLVMAIGSVVLFLGVRSVSEPMTDIPVAVPTQAAPIPIPVAIPTPPPPVAPVTPPEVPPSAQQEPSGVIQSILRIHNPEVRRCYETGLTRRPGLTGRVNLAFTIGADGRVSSATVRSSTLGDPAVEACIARSVADLRFPPTGNPVEVETPFNFQSSQ